MSNRTLQMALAATVLCLGACGNEFTSSGGGSKTFEVVASGTFEASDTDPDTVVDVFVRLGGVPSLDATVTLIDGLTDEAFVAAPRNPGEFRARISGYRRLLELQVEDGDDNLRGKIAGPTPHSLARPKNGAERNVSRKINVEWSARDGIKAQEVFIALNDDQITDTVKDDDGHYTIGREGLNVGSASVTVERRERIKLSGGTSGSTFTLGYSVTNTLQLVNN